LREYDRIVRPSKRRIGLLLLLFAAAMTMAIVRSRKLDRFRDSGRKAAAGDIANQTPWIRRSLGRSRLDEQGLGIDRGTGLPLQRTGGRCGTAQDSEAEAAEDEAYNETILTALSEGRLRRFRLEHKLRSKSEVERLFVSPARLAKHGDSLATPDRKFVLELRRDRIYLARPGAKTWLVLMSYPSAMRKGTAWWAHPPFDAVFTDENTTAILRDRGGFIWTIDLPRALVVQLLPPTP